MIWKAAAEEKLIQYPAKVAAIENLQAQLRALKLGASPMLSPQYTQPRVCTTPGRQEDALLEAMAWRQEMEWSLERAQTWVQVTRRALDTLGEGDRRLLECLYMDPEAGQLERLCQRLQLERSSIYRRRDNALRRFTVALYGGS